MTRSQPSPTHHSTLPEILAQSYGAKKGSWEQVRLCSLRHLPARDPEGHRSVIRSFLSSVLSWETTSPLTLR